MGVCPKCSNSDKNYFGNKNGKIYCRKCLTFIGKCADKEYKIKEGNYDLGYSLTSYQKAASEFILNNVKEGKNCALNAVCGAGKTEIIYDTIEEAELAAKVAAYDHDIKSPLKPYKCPYAEHYHLSST